MPVKKRKLYVSDQRGQKYFDQLNRSLIHA